MGMTIDNLELFAIGLEWVGDTEHAKDIRHAIETMRKYQKIEQIVKEWEFDHESMVDSMEKISGVVEDGTN